MDNTKTVLLCSDLDRTLIPNGKAPESPRARPLLRRLAARSEITLVYVTGRGRSLIEDAIVDYDLPVPDYAVGDVGTTIYRIDGDRNNLHFSPWTDWQADIGQDWGDWSHDAIAALFSDFDELTLQPPGNQTDCKLSYYVTETEQIKAIAERVGSRLAPYDIRATIITSIDEMAGVGLLDILPERATKVHAIAFLMKKSGFDASGVVYAGDSGNDLPALTSGYPAILVKNAADDVREEAVEAVSEKGQRSLLYLAQGDFMGLNGNYSAGVIEGLAHFMPQSRQWIREALEAL
ncbi:MAG: HAD-IIB family hydrolase [Thermodesulfobacteriota bacterium]